MMRLALVAWILILCCTGVGAVRAAENPTAMVYTYPPPEGEDDQRMTYYWELLGSALEATTPKWGPYVLKPSPVAMGAARSQSLLADSKVITMLVRTTSIERETLMRPVLIPVDKGLTGYRLFLIQKSTQAKLRRVHTLGDLKAFSIGQGSQWVDTDILRQAGFKVEPGASYASLFKMLQAGRFDIFSRGVNEIGKELRAGRATNGDLAIERTLLLYYPLPRYYFFARTPEGDRLARRVEEGLHLLIDNGQFDKQYNVYKRQMLADLQLSGRRVFKIKNPTLSQQTPLAHSEYWDTLADEIQVRH